MKKLKELLSDTLVYGISSVLARFIGYLLVPLHTASFSTSQYGVVSLVYAGLVFLNVIFTFGMESAYLRYGKDREQARNTFKTLQISLAVLSSLLAGLLVLLAPVLMPTMNLQASGSQLLYWMMIGILWFDTMVIIPFAELRLVRRQWLFACFKTANIIVNVGLQFYLILWLDWSIEAVFFASLIASGLTALMLWIVTAPMLTGSWDRSMLQKALKFGLPFIPAGLGFAVNETIDRFFLGNYLPQSTVTELYGASMSPDDIVGIYSACYKVSVFMLLLVQMFRMAWQPFFLRESDDPDAPGTYREVFRYFNVVAGICFLFVALFAQKIVQIKVPLLDAYLVGQDYWMGLHIVPLLLGAYWFHGWYMNFSAGIFIKEKTKVLPVIMLIGATITIVVNLALIPYFGMMGAAWSTLVSYMAMALLLYYQSTKIYTVNYQMIRALGMMGWAVACWVLQPWLGQWLASEWTSRIFMLIIGTAGLIIFAWPTSKKRSRT